MIPIHSFLFCASSKSISSVSLFSIPDPLSLSSGEQLRPTVRFARGVQRQEDRGAHSGGERKQ
jgi:hypothetical protein